ncbi:MAG: AraC family transcriptional regulator [Algibacter sp.]|uniref:helix-turn-helix domain-containing protein n=1 Tax=Algibacter sp. TaxID=1872428 RepID=UPI0032990F77
MLLQKQISYSQDLLIDTDKNIKEIALEMNYQDEYYFSRIFKNKTGMSPSEYRLSKL